jgi:hypothetical protein
VIPNRTVFSRVAAADPSAAQAPSAAGFSILHQESSRFTALSFFYLSNRHTLSVVFGHDLQSLKAGAERLSHMTELVPGYVLR